jgi:MoxR-like ATPase
VLQTRLEAHGYLADDGLATAAYLSLAMGRPLFLEGDAGVGKTSLATALGELLQAPVIRLQCYEGIDASQALYDWDFPRQLLHLRAVEAAGAPSDEATIDRLDSEVYSRRFLLARPLLAALETTPCVLLIDEVDRSDDEFEAFLLQVLSDYAVTIPELGTVRAAVPPVAVLTSNRTREVHDALKRRCLYHWVEHPSFEREVAIIRRQVPAASASLARQVAAATQLLREEDLAKPPGVAESIDWTLALLALGAERLDPDSAIATLGAVLKYREDQERARRMDVGAMIAAAISGG